MWQTSNLHKTKIFFEDEAAQWRNHQLNELKVPTFIFNSKGFTSFCCAGSLLQHLQLLLVSLNVSFLCLEKLFGLLCRVSLGRHQHVCDWEDSCVHFMSSVRVRVRVPLAANTSMPELCSTRLTGDVSCSHHELFLCPFPMILLQVHLGFDSNTQPLLHVSWFWVQSWWHAAHWKPSAFPAYASFRVFSAQCDAVKLFFVTVEISLPSSVVHQAVDPFCLRMHWPDALILNLWQGYKGFSLASKANEKASFWLLQSCINQLLEVLVTRLDFPSLENRNSKVAFCDFICYVWKKLPEHKSSVESELSRNDKREHFPTLGSASGWQRAGVQGVIVRSCTRTRAVRQRGYRVTEPWSWAEQMVLHMPVVCVYFHNYVQIPTQTFTSANMNSASFG